jgi:hypothetical protein
MSESPLRNDASHAHIEYHLSNEVLVWQVVFSEVEVLHASLPEELLDDAPAAFTITGHIGTERSKAGVATHMHSSDRSRARSHTGQSLLITGGFAP